MSALSGVNEYKFRRTVVGVRSFFGTFYRVSRTPLFNAAGHFGASQLTIHLTPNLSVTIPNASAQ
jgi:hypothetical protein